MPLQAVDALLRSFTGSPVLPKLTPIIEKPTYEAASQVVRSKATCEAATQVEESMSNRLCDAATHIEKPMCEAATQVEETMPSPMCEVADL